MEKRGSLPNYLQQEEQDLGSPAMFARSNKQRYNCFSILRRLTNHNFP